MKNELCVFDDSGLLGLVAIEQYPTFLGENWEYEQLMIHFADQMQIGSILVWECGDGGDAYRLQIRDRITDQKGFREITGRITTTADRLFLASYTALTMAAQFDDYKIPGSQEESNYISLSPGLHRVRVVQMHDPDSIRPQKGEPHFIVEIEQGDGPIWEDVAWRSA